MTQYFLYARKSTDDKDRQVHSIEDQIAVLRKLAKKEGLTITETFEERQSAKVPGRPVFNGMMARIQRGEAQGILCWKLDRLARNPVDAAQIQWLLQRNSISHIQTHDRSYYPSDNVLLMSVEFGMANQYVRDLSSNTSRGLLQKAKRGEFPGTAPTGYRNNPRTKLVVVDRKKAPVVRAAFELYAKGNSRLEDISAYLYINGVRSLYGNRIHKDRVKFILTNPFYYGYFYYKGELIEGKHTPLIEKRLFDKVQKAMLERGHPQAATSDPQPLCGLLTCGECGMRITAEVRTKSQKNGKVHRWIYYRCSKKGGACAQPYVRDATLVDALNQLLAEYAMPSLVVEDFTKRMEADEREAANAASVAADALREKTAAISEKLDRLTDVYVAQDIERHDYLSRRAALLSERKSVEEVLAKCEQGGLPWLEPMRAWINHASMLAETAKDPSLPAKKSALQKIFGSNLFLKNQTVSFLALPHYAELRSAKNILERETLSNSLLRDLDVFRTPDWEEITRQFNLIGLFQFTTAS